MLPQTLCVNINKPITRSLIEKCSLILSDPFKFVGLMPCQSHSLDRVTSLIV